MERACSVTKNFMMLLAFVEEKLHIITLQEQKEFLKMLVKNVCLRQKMQKSIGIFFSTNADVGIS